MVEYSVRIECHFVIKIVGRGVSRISYHRESWHNSDDDNDDNDDDNDDDNGDDDDNCDDNDDDNGDDNCDDDDGDVPRSLASMA